MITSASVTRAPAPSVSVNGPPIAAAPPATVAAPAVGEGVGAGPRAARQSRRPPGPTSDGGGGEDGGETRVIGGERSGSARAVLARGALCTRAAGLKAAGRRQIPLSAGGRGCYPAAMTEPDLSVFTAAARSAWLRLRTLILLRWLAVFGQSAAVLVAGSGSASTCRSRPARW